MQTYVTDLNMRKNADNLDFRRLGQNRVEALDVLCLNLELSQYYRPAYWEFLVQRYSNHPVVHMWKGHGAYLHFYTYYLLKKWRKLGYSNAKCWPKWKEISILFPHNIAYYGGPPPWLTPEFVDMHRAYLIRKDPGYYRKIWPNVDESIPFVYPVTKETKNEQNICL
jgi:hypothetical protein